MIFFQWRYNRFQILYCVLQAIRYYWSNFKVAASSEPSTSVPSTLLTVSGTGGITIDPNDGGVETTATIIETINESAGTTTIQEVIIIGKSFSQCSHCKWRTPLFGICLTNHSIYSFWAYCQKKKVLVIPQH